MQRGLRHTSFALASAASLLVFICVLALWIRSTIKLDRIRSGTPTRRTTIHSKYGEIYIDFATASSPIWRPGYQHIHALPTQFRPPNPSWDVAGLGSGTETVYEGDVVIRRKFAEIPLWPIAVVTLILPVLWFDEYARRRRTPSCEDSMNVDHLGKMAAQEHAL